MPGQESLLFCFSPWTRLARQLCRGAASGSTVLNDAKGVLQDVGSATCIGTCFGICSAGCHRGAVLRCIKEGHKAPWLFQAGVLEYAAMQLNSCGCVYWDPQPQPPYTRSCTNSIKGWCMCQRAHSLNNH